MRVAILTTATLLVASSVSAAPFTNLTQHIDNGALERREDGKDAQAKPNELSDSKDGGKPNKPNDLKDVGKGLNDAISPVYYRRIYAVQPVVPVQPHPFPPYVPYRPYRLDPVEKKHDGLSKGQKTGLIVGGTLLGGGLLAGAGAGALCFFKLCRAAKELPTNISSLSTVDSSLSRAAAEMSDESLTLSKSTATGKKANNDLELKTDVHPPPNTSSLSRRQIVYVKEV